MNPRRMYIPDERVMPPSYTEGIELAIAERLAASRRLWSREQEQEPVPGYVLAPGEWCWHCRHPASAADHVTRQDA